MKRFFDGLEERFEAYMEDLVRKVKANPQDYPQIEIIGGKDDEDDTLIWKLRWEWKEILMKLFLSHAVYRTLTLSRLFNALGATIYNLVFVIYAASLPRPSLAIFLANMVPMIPIVFTFWLGVLADKSQNKGQKMMIIAFVQALLFS